MKLPRPNVHEECDCENCFQCDRPIGDQPHFRCIEQMDFDTMEFVNIGPMHGDCVRYRMLGMCPDHTRLARAGAAGLN